MTDPLLYASDLHERKKNPKDDSWKKGPKITLTNCVEGKGEMQKTTMKEILGNKFTPDDEMKFGKHKGQKLAWVKANDRGYWDWAIDNVDGFERLAKGVK